jgi:hypothetical protein
MLLKYKAIVNREGNNKDKSDEKNGNKDTITIKQVAIW